MEGFIYPGSNAMEFRGWCGWCCTEISSTDPDRSPLFLSSTLSPGLACLGRTEDVLGAWCQMEMLSLIQQIHCCAEKISRSWRKSRVIAICGNNKGYPSLSPPLQPWAGDSDSLAGCWLWRALSVPWITTGALGLHQQPRAQGSAALPYQHSQQVPFK